MGLTDKIKEKAKSDIKRIVLPESEDERIIKGAVEIAKQGIAKVILLGNEDAIKQRNKDADVSGIEIIDPENSEKFDQYSETFYNLRKDRGVSPEDAKEICKNPLYYGVMMIQNNDADGMVAGAINSTGDTLRPALQVLRTQPGVSIVSSCFLMEVPLKQYGDQGTLIFADCAININPDAEQLSAIALASADTAKNLAGIDPKVAMLSFSTKGSAKDESVDKVAKATEIIKEQNPSLAVDGELQADTALVPAVGKLKAPDSTVAGEANVLVFPNLDAGNIGYKLVQRLGHAKAIGPVVQGLARPVNDLSRGCSVEDVISVSAITAVQAQSF